MTARIIATMFVALWCAGMLYFGLIALYKGFYMPGFWKQMPKADDEADKLFIACVRRTNPFNGGGEVWSAPVRGKRRAYLAARWNALLWDWKTPYADGELGIDWALRLPENDDGRRS